MSLRQCFCGCDHFKFKKTDGLFAEDPQKLWYNICKNCNHALGDHVDIVRSKQAD